jgi:MoaA/NifB/PqqE/SkfB family radical SAM enzyme
MSLLPEKFCVAPFLQLTTHPSGSFSPCPYLGGTSWKKYYPTILERWHSDDLEALREDFVNNRQNSICNRCWHEEKNNKQSLRLRLWDPVNQTSDYSTINNTNVVEDLVHGLADKKYLNGIKMLTIKNGNLCNAKCRVCHPGDSSRWAIEDAAKLQQITGNTYYNIMQVEKNWTDEQIQEIINLSPTLERLELFGGEPLYNKKVIYLLNHLVESGESQHIVIYINTNGSVDLSSQVPCLIHFKEVEIGVSIDDIGDRFNYQRHGLDYDQVISNIRRWQIFFNAQNTKYYIDSITTVNAFNVWNLPAIKQAVKELLPQAPFWNLLVEPKHLFIKNLPDEFKHEVVEKLSQDLDEFSDLINVIQQPRDDAEWQKFKEITNGLDLIRKENAANIFPELAKYLLQ